MKNQITALILVLGSLSAQAQYGHRVYNADTSSNEQFNDGLITDIIRNGNAPVYAAGGFSIGQTSTGASFFRSRFNTVNFNGTQLSGSRYFIFQNSSELQNRVNSIAEVGTPGYVLSGTVFSSSTSGDVMILNVNTSGVPIVGSMNSINMNAFDEAFCTRRSRNNLNRYYTCGSSAPAALTTSESFLIKHSVSGGTVDWTRRFNLSCNGVVGRAEAVSVVDDSLTGNVVIVGNIRGSNNTCQQAFIARFTSTGTLTWLRILNSTSLSNIELQSIRATDSAQVYVITGSAISSTLAGRRQVLLMRVSTSGAAGPVNRFVKLIRSNGPTPNYPVVNQNGFDVVTRRDSLNRISYYISGVTQLSGGATDGLLIRANSSGNPVFLREYFGQDREGLFAIDMVDARISGTLRQGIAAFGTFDATNTSVNIRKKSWLTKTYFNLESGCNQINDSPILTNPAVSYTPVNPSLITTSVVTSLSAQTSSTVTQQICWNTTLAAGSNARLDLSLASTDLSTESGLNITAYPNPVAGNELNVKLSVSMDDIATVTLVDVTGKRFFEDRMELLAGENQSTLQLNDLPAGMYVINVITDSGNKQSLRFIRK